MAGRQAHDKLADKLRAFLDSTKAATSECFRLAEESFRAGDARTSFLYLARAYQKYDQLIQQQGIGVGNVLTDDATLIDSYITFDSEFQKKLASYKSYYEEFKPKYPEHIKEILSNPTTPERKAMFSVINFYDSPIVGDNEFVSSLRERQRFLRQCRKDRKAAAAAIASGYPMMRVESRPRRDLRDFPTPVRRNPSDRHVSVGDLHGNALKLIYILIEEGFLSLTPSDYATLLRIYSSDLDSSTLTSASIAEFKRIITAAPCNNERALTLIGDVLCDRGANDYLTLLVLKKLKDSDVDVDIMLSNHDSEFIKDYEKESFTGTCTLGEEPERTAKGIDVMASQGISLQRMKELIDRGVVTEIEVRELVAYAYVPVVKAISYTVSPDGKAIVISAHAPVGLEVIEKLAEKFGIVYVEDTIEDLISTIDDINRRVGELLSSKELSAVMQDEFSVICARGDDSYALYGAGFITPEFPLQRLMWSRDAGGIRTIALDGSPLNYAIHFQNGHIGAGGTLYPAHDNLDCDFGKHRRSARGDKGNLTVAYSQGMTAHQLEMRAGLFSIPEEEIVPVPVPTPMLVEDADFDLPIRVDDLTHGLTDFTHHCQYIEAVLLSSEPFPSHFDFDASISECTQMKGVIQGLYSEMGEKSLTTDSPLHEKLEKIHKAMKNGMCEKALQRLHKLKSEREALPQEVERLLETIGRLKHSLEEMERMHKASSLSPDTDKKIHECELLIEEVRSSYAKIGARTLPTGDAQIKNLEKIHKAMNNEICEKSLELLNKFKSRTVAPAPTAAPQARPAPTASRAPTASIFTFKDRLPKHDRTEEPGSAKGGPKK